jgi:peptidoglycan/LPS O-acetylase OafA/YrhL
MRRKICSVVLIGLLAAVPAFADTGERAPKASSTTKRVVWTLVGAGAGFAAGVFIGLNKFDDALYSDRKVWTSAIVGAAGGAVAGALLSRPSKQSPSTSKAGQPAERVDVTWSEAIGGAPSARPLPR